MLCTAELGDDGRLSIALGDQEHIEVLRGDLS